MNTDSAKFTFISGSSSPTRDQRPNISESERMPQNTSDNENVSKELEKASEILEKFLKGCSNLATTFFIPLIKEFISLCIYGLLLVPSFLWMCETIPSIPAMAAAKCFADIVLNGLVARFPGLLNPVASTRLRFF